MKPVKAKPIAGAAAAAAEDNEVFVSKVRATAEPELKPVNFPEVRVSPPERQEKAFNIRVPWPADGPGMSRYVERQDQVPRELEPAPPVHEHYPGLVRDAVETERDKGRGR